LVEDLHSLIGADVPAIVADGRLRPMIDPARFALIPIAAAHRHLQSGRPMEVHSMPV
jgi:hypothetical protein